MEEKAVADNVVVQMPADTTQPGDITEQTRTPPALKSDRVTRSRATQKGFKVDKPYSAQKKAKPVTAAPIQPRRTSNRERPPSLKFLENIQYGMTDRLPPPQMLKNKEEQLEKQKEEETDRPVIRPLYHYQPPVTSGNPMPLPHHYTQVVETPLQLAPISPTPPLEQAAVAPRPCRTHKKRSTSKTAEPKQASDSPPYCDTPSPEREAWFAQKAEEEKKEKEEKDQKKKGEQKRMPSYQDIYVNVLDDDDDGPLSSGRPSPMINGVGHTPAGVSTYENSESNGQWMGYMDNY